MNPEEFLTEIHQPWRQQGWLTVPVLVVRSCDHEETVELQVCSDERAIYRLRRRPCAKCAESVEANFQDQVKQARERAELEKLPELVAGTPRQADYALVCRDVVLSRFGRKGAVGTALQAITNAKWWIDNRRRTRFMKVFNELVEPGGPLAPPTNRVSHR